MWMRLPNNRIERVMNPDHISRLLAEGAVEIPDPSSEKPKVQQAEPNEAEEKPTEQAEQKAVESEQPDASTTNDEQPDHPDPADDSRSGGGGPAVQRPANTTKGREAKRVSKASHSE